jgi:hypothetical protein
MVEALVLTHRTRDFVPTRVVRGETRLARGDAAATGATTQHEPSASTENMPTRVDQRRARYGATRARAGVARARCGMYETKAAFIGSWRIARFRNDPRTTQPKDTTPRSFVHNRRAFRCPSRAAMTFSSARTPTRFFLLALALVATRGVDAGSSSGSSLGCDNWFTRLFTRGCGASENTEPCPVITTVSDFSLAAYVESHPWYVQEQQPNGYQPVESLFCVRASYAFEDDAKTVSSDPVPYPIISFLPLHNPSPKANSPLTSSSNFSKPPDCLGLQHRERRVRGRPASERAQNVTPSDRSRPRRPVETGGGPSVPAKQPTRPVLDRRGEPSHTSRRR